MRPGTVPVDHSIAVPVAGNRQIRNLRREDREPLQRLLSATGMFTEEEIGIALELIDAVLDRPEQKDYIIRCCEAAGVVAGYYCIGPTPATDGTFDLYWIAVAKEAQGSGIGRLLNAHAEDLARHLGGRLLVAETSSQQKYEPTRSFYRTQEYGELARIRDYYRPGDDLVVYGKYLT
jgi:ribosomal protein S18 acetylase RimI-like enzyme